ncbi:EI24 domain-containing protein, partial [Sulfurimonas sp. MAG313]
FMGLALLPLVSTLVILFSTLGYGMQVLDDGLKSVRVEKTTTEYSNKNSTHTQSSLDISYDENATSTSFFDINPIALLSSLQNSDILSSMLEYSWIRWIIEKIVLLIAGYFILILAVIIAVIIIGFFTPLIIKKIKSRHYPPLEIKGHGSIATTLWFTFKSLIIMIIFYIVLIPFYFIPLLNIVAFNLPAYYFFHKMLVFDVGSSINTKKEFLHIRAMVGNQIRLRTFFMYLLTLIPFVGILFPVFFVIYLSHIFMSESVELRMATH